MGSYGKELILDLHNCSIENFDRKGLKRFFVGLCDLIGMQRCKLTYWDYKNEPEEYEKAPIHLKGTSAVQFISTSNITIHTLDKMERVYINIFSCKEFDVQLTIGFVKGFFVGKVVHQALIERI